MDWYDEIIEQMRALEPNLFGSYLVTIKIVEHAGAFSKLITDFVSIDNDNATWEHDWNEGQVSELMGFINIGDLEIRGYDPTIRKVIVQNGK